MNTNNFDRADLFWGSEESRLPRPEGLAEKWYKLKAQIGNTHPGALLPYGMVSAAPYSGGYPTGYSMYTINSYGRPPRYIDEVLCKGFTHFQVSGTGTIRKYYNFFRMIPLTDAGLEGADTMHRLVNEHAVPGFYEADLGDTGIHAELTAGRKKIWHRYTFTKNAPAVAVDMLQCGIAMKFHDDNVLKDITVSKRAPGVYDAKIYCNMPFYACIRVCDACVSSQILLDGAAADAAAVDAADGHSLYLLLSGREQKPLSIEIAFSLRSSDQAFANLTADEKDFDTARAAAADVWKDRLSCIEAEMPNDDMQEIFSSAMYQSMIKPTNFENESPCWEDKDCFLDFSTMWDMYKTQLPLILTLFSDLGAGMVNGLLNIGELLGEFPNSVGMVERFAFKSDQALSLMVYTVTDAYWRKTPGVDWNRALRVIDMDLTAKHGKIDENTRLTHLLDYGEACISAAKMADDMGRADLSAKFREFAHCEDKAYNPETGLLYDSIFYEGQIKTYSFRMMHDMQKRIRTCPNRETLVELLDSFFGFTSEPAPQDFIGLSEEENKVRTNKYLRFEGLNNEPDMETPFFYLYLNQSYKTAQILHDVFACMFATGRGGISGNNDSGALSSWYVWNSIGLYPVPGQDLVLIGSPVAKKACVRLATGKKLNITVENFGENNIYVDRVVLNGETLNRRWLTVDEMMNGGDLTFTMTDLADLDEDFELPPSRA